jgi:hypothetical protein
VSIRALVVGAEDTAGRHDGSRRVSEQYQKVIASKGCNSNICVNRNGLSPSSEKTIMIKNGNSITSNDCKIQRAHGL